MFVNASRGARARSGLVIAALVAVCSLGLASGNAAGEPACATPELKAPAYAAGDSNELTWTLPADPTGTKYTIEIAVVADTDSNGLPDTDTDGSFADDILERPAFEVFSAPGRREIENLQERKHFYHLRSNAKTGNGGACSVGPWSNLMSTIQDNTKPNVFITTEDGTAHVGTVSLEGQAVDPLGGMPDGPPAPSASGVHSVVVSLARSLPPVSVFGPDPHDQIAYAQDANAATFDWDVTFDGVNPGVYVATAVAFDSVGNESASSDPITVIVLGPPNGE